MTDYLTIVLTALQEVDAQVFPGTLPVSDAKEIAGRLPAVVYKQIGGGGIYDHEPGPSLENPLFEFRCWAKLYADAHSLANEVIDVLDTIGIQVTGKADRLEPQTGAWSVVLTGSAMFNH